MRWLWILGGVLVGVPALLALVGALLPRDHVARRSMVLKSPPDRIWALISDLEGTARWRTDITRVEALPPVEGRIRFVEHSRQGRVPFEVVSREEGRRQVVRVIDDDQPFGGTWTWELTPEGAGTRLRITEAGFLKNPIFRVLGKVFFSPSATIERYLRALAAELGETAVPEPDPS